MVVQVVQSPPIRVAMLRHLGPYDGISPLFDQICGWAQTYNVPMQRVIGIYWDNPDYVSASKLRSAACVEIPEGYQITNTGGLTLYQDHLPGGLYATTTFVGPYDRLAPVWSNFTSYIEGTLRRRILDTPAFEVYVNDASTTPPEQLITKLYMPVV